LAINAISCVQCEAGGIVANRPSRFVFQRRAEDERVVAVEPVGLLQTNFAVVKVRHGRVIGAVDNINISDHVRMVPFQQLKCFGFVE
jgi:hypothetical protein